MRRTHACLLAAVLSVGAIGTVPSYGEDHQAKLPAGIQQTTKDDSEDIRDTLGEVTEAAATKGGFDDLVERFVDADRNRLNKFANDNKEKFATLDGRIDQLRKDWKAKYGKDLDLDHKVAFGNAFQGFAIAQGEIMNPALLSNWPVQNKPDVEAKSSTEIKTDTTVKKESGTVADVKDDVKRNVNDLTGGDRNLNKGRNVAVVVFPASHGMPELMVSMIHELPDTWRIDVPDNIDGQKLHDSLLKHLTMFGEMKDQWPADVNEASRALSHHVLAAVYGVDNAKK